MIRLTFVKIGLKQSTFYRFLDSNVRQIQTARLQTSRLFKKYRYYYHCHHLELTVNRLTRAFSGVEVYRLYFLHTEWTQASKLGSGATPGNKILHQLEPLSSKKDSKSKKWAQSSVLFTKLCIFKQQSRMFDGAQQTCLIPSCTSPLYSCSVYFVGA